MTEETLKNNRNNFTNNNNRNNNNKNNNNKPQTILEVAVYYPIMDKDRYVGAVNVEKVKNPNYLDTVTTITQYTLDLNTFITNSVKKDEPLYFLPIGPELYKKIKEYTIKLIGRMCRDL